MGPNLLVHSKKSVETLKSTRIMIAVLTTAVAIERCVSFSSEPHFIYFAVLVWGIVASLYCLASMYKKMKGVVWVGRLTLIINILTLLSLWPLNYRVASLFILVQFWFIPAFFPIGSQYQLINPSFWQDQDRTKESSWRQRYQSAALNLFFGIIFMQALSLGALWADTSLIQMVLLWGIVLRHFVTFKLWQIFYEENRKWFWFFVAALGVPLAAWPLLGATMAFGLDLVFSLIFLRFLLRGHPAAAQLAKTFSGSPAIYILASFFGLSVVGALLLSLPLSQLDGQSIGALDAMFTAVSAVCVTGLITVDPSQTLSTVGLVILLLLIQIGGLGIMVFSTFFAVSMGESLGIRREKAIGQIVNQSSVQDTYSLIKFIVLSTLTIEACGAAILTWRFYLVEGSWLTALWKGIFHSVSAFCNAGFSLQPDSLVSLNSDPLLLTTISVLIALGGLGFSVMASIVYFLAGKRRRLDLHSRVVLVMTSLLLVVGFILPLLIEWSHSLKDLSIGQKFVNAWFYSATLRTAGFNSFSMTDVQPATILMSLIFMFIGGAPGGTAGGIKVTTLMVLFASLSSHVQQKPFVHVFKREFYRGDLDKSIVVLTFSVFTVLAISFGLLLTQTGSFVPLLFEAFSAVGTVGMSIGATQNLDAVGKVLIIVGMILGRVGPLTFLFAFDWKGNSRVSFPREKVLIG